MGISGSWMAFLYGAGQTVVTFGTAITGTLAVPIAAGSAIVVVGAGVVAWVLVYGVDRFVLPQLVCISRSSRGFASRLWALLRSGGGRRMVQAAKHSEKKARLSLIVDANVQM